MKELSQHVPVIGVITTAVADGGFAKTVEDLLPEARNVVRVNSLPQVMDGGLTIAPHGLNNLVEITMEVIPEGQKNAFAAAQRIVLSAKVSRARMVVAAAATTAAGSRPCRSVSDALAIVPIQITMLASVSACSASISRWVHRNACQRDIHLCRRRRGGQSCRRRSTEIHPWCRQPLGGTISAAVASSFF